MDSINTEQIPVEFSVTKKSVAVVKRYSLKELRNEKEHLETVIAQLLQDFEEDFGFIVNDIAISHLVLGRGTVSKTNTKKKKIKCQLLVNL